jgi:hypothetical protein
MSFRDTQNPGIGGLDELTLNEEIAIQTIAALGTPGYFLRTNLAGTAVEWAAAAGSGTIDGSGTANELAYWVDTDTLGALAVATYPSLTELAYLKGVTSAIQTQINAKQASDVQLTSIAGLAYASNALKVIRVNAGETDFELATIAAGGDVTKVGTPVDNQIGIWTGDGTIEGYTGFTFNPATDDLTLNGGTTINLLGDGALNFDAGGGDGYGMSWFASSGTTNNSSGGYFDFYGGQGSGVGTGANGGGFEVYNGDGFGTGHGGNLYFEAGTGGATGNGGSLGIYVGNGGATSGNGGGITLFSGNAPTSGSGGNFTIELGTGAGAGTHGDLIIVNGSADANGPILQLYQNSASPVADDVVGTINFYGKDSAGNKQLYASLYGGIETETSTSEGGRLRFGITASGSYADKLELAGTALFPTTNDGLRLGTSVRQFSDLFLAEGGVINWDNGDATLTQAGNDVTLAGASLTARVKPRTGTTTSSATPTINTDDVDFYSITAQTVDITSFTTNLSGTPTEGQTLWIAITGTGARAITWGASFEASTVALPTTTVTTNRLDVGFVWNSVSSKWRCLASG